MPTDPPHGPKAEGQRLTEDFLDGLRQGLTVARSFVMAAPTYQPGGVAQTRNADFPGGVSRVADRAKDPDGDPSIVVNVYALRDAVLGWIDRAIEESHG